jgi:hypothetical protein
MKYESTICSLAVLPRTWRLTCFAILLGASLVVSTLQAQDPTPTPAPSGSPPAATELEGLAQIRDEVIAFRRLVIIMAGISLGWSTCLLIFKHH